MCYILPKIQLKAVNRTYVFSLKCRRIAKLRKHTSIILLTAFDSSDERVLLKVCFYRWAKCGDWL